MLKNLIDRLTCSHRHTIDEHPACFASGNVNAPKAYELYDMTGKYWYNLDGLKIGYLDIETDGLKVDFSTMLTWCIKERDGDICSDVITKDELFSGDADRRIVESCINKIKEYKIICTYYGTVFDITFLRAKALHYGIPFPGLVIEEKETKTGIIYKTVPEVYHYDLYYTVKSKLASLSSKRLENACDWLGIHGKTPISKDAWRAAKYGDPEALAVVLEHNKGDVVILEELHNKLEPFVCFSRKGA